MKRLGRRLMLPFTVVVLLSLGMIPGCEDDKKVTEPEPVPSTAVPDGKLEPLPNPIGQQPGSAPPPVGAPSGGATPPPGGGPPPVGGATPNPGPIPSASPSPSPTPTPTPGPTPSPGATPSPDPTINVALSGPNATDFQTVKVQANGNQTIYKDETWSTPLAKGDVLIRSTNAKRGDLGNPQATLTLTSSVPVTVILHHSNPFGISWISAQGFDNTMPGLDVGAPTPVNPDAAIFFSRWTRAAGLTLGISDVITLGPNFETEASPLCKTDKTCQSMYFLVIRPQ